MKEEDFNKILKHMESDCRFYRKTLYFKKFGIWFGEFNVELTNPKSILETWYIFNKKERKILKKIKERIYKEWKYQKLNKLLKEL